MSPTGSYAEKIEAYRRELLEHALGLQRTYFCRLLRDRGITYQRKAS